MNSRAIVLSANAEKKAFTAPILVKASSPKKCWLIEPLVSKITTIASVGSIFELSYDNYYYFFMYSGFIFTFIKSSGLIKSCTISESKYSKSESSVI